MDNKFTEKLAAWIATPKGERDILAGATMLLQLNRNRFLYANIVRRPEKFADKLEYELKKHLRIRLDGLTLNGVAEMDAKVIPAAKETLDRGLPAVSTDAELPEAKVATGKRADHDQLPAEIQALWDENLHHYKVIKQVFEKLKTMEDAEPCDRYEYLKILDEADKKYRKNLEMYDNFVPGSEIVATVPVLTPAQKQEQRRKVNAARKTLTKYKAILKTALAGDDAEKAGIARNKILSCVQAIRDNDHVVGDSVKAELAELGIDIGE